MSLSLKLSIFDVVGWLLLIDASCQPLWGQNIYSADLLIVRLVDFPSAVGSESM